MVKFSESSSDLKNIIMQKLQLEYYLKRGNTVGFEMPTGDPEYLGWILISKQEPNARLLGLFTEEEESYWLIRKEHRKLTHPYFVHRFELKRSVHEAGDYETEA